MTEVVLKLLATKVVEAEVDQVAVAAAAAEEAVDSEDSLLEACQL